MQLSPRPYAHQRALTIAHIVLEVYSDEMRRFVYESFKKDLARLVHSNDQVVQVTAQDRTQALEAWHKCRYPWGYAENSHVLLSRAVNTTLAAAGPGLPLFQSGVAMSYQKFGEALVDISLAPVTSRVKAPALGTGSFIHILRRGVQQMMRLTVIRSDVRTPSEDDRKLFAAFVLYHAAKALVLHHVPWCANSPPGLVGRPSYRVLHTIYRTIGAAQDPMTLTRLLNVDITCRDTDLSSASASSSTIQRNDPSAEWSILDVKLENLHQILHKTVPPTQVILTNVEYSQNSEPITSSYEWASAHLKMTNPIHQLIVIIAMVVTRDLPFVMRPDKLSSHFSSDKTRDRITRDVQSIELLQQSDNHKGSGNVNSWFTIFVIFALNMVTSGSPLRNWLKQNHNAMGDRWTKKHGQSFAFMVGLNPNITHTPITRPQGNQRVHSGALRAVLVGEGRHFWLPTIWRGLPCL